MDKVTVTSPNQRILHTVQLIPRGKVASYGQVADLAGLPGRARMVGRALRSTPDELSVPWYRVLRSNGQIAFPAGSEEAKQQTGLLQEEGVVVMNNRVVMKDCQWCPDLSEILHRLLY